ncbi:MAG: TrkA family potassium uptake protein [Oscillospiraceae bacterium]|nr:TrkA family potassium uptake protein [Oscillospiraceae bacterium]
MKKSYAVFGLGRYGQAVAKELLNNGAEVIAVDKDENIVNEAVSEIPFCKCADITDPEAIKQLGISNVDVVIIAMADSLEASVMATMLCKEAGVENVIVKCGNEMNCRILEKIGADRVVFPEEESGIRLAKNLISSDFIDIMELSKDISMAEIAMRKEWIGKTPAELNLRQKYGINIVAVRNGDDLNIEIDPEKPFKKGMSLIVVANACRLEKLR